MASFQLSLESVDPPFPVGRVWIFANLPQGVLFCLIDAGRLKQPLIWCLWRIVMRYDLRAYPFLRDQFSRGLEEIHVQSEHVVEVVHDAHLFFRIVPSIPNGLSGDSPVLLLVYCRLKTGKKRGWGIQRGRIIAAL